MIEPGTKIPDLLGLDENGQAVHASDFEGRRLALYFYPKDLTSGCTTEACNLRDNYERLRAAGIDVVGVSVDDAKRHRSFIEKHQLPFPLIADTDHRLVEAFGVWAEKKLYGRTYMGTLRTTFIIGPDGRIERVIGPKEVKVDSHAEQILPQE